MSEVNEAINKLKEVRRAIDIAIGILESGNVMARHDRLPDGVMVVGGWAIMPAGAYNETSPGKWTYLTRDYSHPW